MKIRYGKRHPERVPYVNIVLLLMTAATTLVAGALQQGVDPIAEPSRLWEGLPFSVTLLFILGSHEFGHYFVSKRHGVEVTLPYFIPAPSFIGTFGAFIKMKSPIMDRRVLLDIGAAGPIAGMIAAVPVVVAGLAVSE
ncbi:MAG TPA: site-2 protease family protein, partial [Syntrophales bacterium]|nr:site-2 protease family protein [Syntrophales bacterium]